MPTQYPPCDYWYQTLSSVCFFEARIARITASGSSTPYQTLSSVCFFEAEWAERKRVSEAVYQTLSSVCFFEAKTKRSETETTPPVPDAFERLLL